MHQTLRFHFGILIRCIIILIAITLTESCKTSKNVNQSNAPQNERDEKTLLLLKTAKSFKGTRYKAGGTTNSGMDCSGLVVTSFQKINIFLPRTSREQSKLGNEIKMTDAQPGDLIFFATDGKSKGINHVGIVTAISAENGIIFIHSTIRGGVMEDKTNDAYYQKTFEKIMRIY